jgi:hypothetical protein
MQGTNETTERTVLDELYAARAELWREASELRARVHEVDEQIDRITGDVTSAEWHRLTAISERSGKPEDSEAAHRAWVHHMALHYVKRGQRPDMGSHCQAEIDEEIDRLTAEMRQ